MDLGIPQHSKGVAAEVLVFASELNAPLIKILQLLADADLTRGFVEIGLLRDDPALIGKAKADGEKRDPPVLPQ
jgi:hypothetical protein